MLDMVNTPDAINPPQISIISTMYRSRPFLERFLFECLQALSELKNDHFEILLVNDGSPDDSLAYALERRGDIPQLVIIDLSRNFGHHHAIQAGLQHSTGELIFLIDCDLEVSLLYCQSFTANCARQIATWFSGTRKPAREGGSSRLAAGCSGRDLIFSVT